MKLASFKIRFFDRHVRAVPERGLDGAPFSGPGVDLRGEDAERAIAEASGPVSAWLTAREPGVVVRSLSVDRARMRVLVTLEGDNARPRVLRFDPPHAEEIVEAARAAEEVIAAACAVRLAARA